MTDNVHKMWSDDELDQALSALHTDADTDADTDEAKLRQARTELITAAGGSSTAGEPAPRRHRGRWAVAAAAVIVLVAGLLVVQTMQFGDKPAPASAAAAELNSAADKIGASDPPMRPGQYRYIVTHSWSLGTVVSGGTSISMLVEGRSESWVPHNIKEECLIRDVSTGNYKWVKGSDAEAKAMGYPLPTAQTEERRERCIDREGGWQQPTPEWSASLPRDPQQLYDLLRKDTADRGPDPDLEMLVYVADALRGGMVPADLRAALYRALAKVPALEVTEKAANLDGRTGIALGIDRAGTRHDIIIDPDTGQFIGERQVATKEFPELPLGTVTSSSSVTATVVDAIGATK